MDRHRSNDVIEIEQLLARYAVGMTKDDIDAVIDVFTPDGTYSAFGAIYGLVDFPTLVAAAPKGLFLVGPARARARRRHGSRPAAAVLRRPGRPRDAHRLLHRHLSADRAGLAPATRSMTFLRRSGARDAGRSARPAAPGSDRPTGGR